MSLMYLAPGILNAVFSAVVYYIQVIWLFYWKMAFWCWILVIGRYAIMFRFGTRFLALKVVIIYDNNVIDIVYKYTTSSWHLNGFPNGSNLGSTVSCRGETHRDTIHLN